MSSTIPNPPIRVINHGLDAFGSGPLTLINCYSVMSIPAYARAVNFIADTLASFPRAVHKGDAPAAKQDETHPVDELLQLHANAYQNPFVLWRTWFAHAAGQYANGYLRIDRDPRTLRPVALHTELPGDILPIRVWPEGATSPAQYYQHKPTKTMYSGADILHLQGPSYDGLAGTDPVAQFRGTFQLAHTVNKFQIEFYNKGTVVRASVEFPPGVEMDDDDIEEYVDMIRRHYYGPERDRDILVLPNGGKLNNATVKPAEADVIKLTSAITKQISQITGVPPEFLHEFSESKYNNNLEQMGQNVVRYTFRPWLKQAEEELSLKLLTSQERRDGYRIKLNPDALLRGDTNAVNKSAIDTRKAGIRTGNESRELIGLPRIDDPEADKLQVVGSSTPADATPPSDASA